MLQETLVLKDDFLGTFYYEGRGQAPRTVNGKAGKYARHIVNSERHGVVHIITDDTADVIPFDAQVRVVGGLLYPDYALNGRNVAPALNVLAKKLEIMKGGN
ncbi:cytoplasmic protein [Streptococcus entericus]|uniref:hypothetical protein n=1 Tax=Streptococcus entericus TaxID=155680 RepID=UPI0003706307|nr:hypothetical protein [Streptococcus entericus]